MHADREFVTTAIVVPCYNEAGRLDVDAFVEFVGTRPWLTFVFVDDGSTDGTKDLLAAAVQRSPDCIIALVLEENCGKAEAVRRGLLATFESGLMRRAAWKPDNVKQTPTSPNPNTFHSTAFGVPRAPNSLTALVAWV